MPFLPLSAQERMKNMKMFLAEFDFAPKFHCRLMTYISPIEGVNMEAPSRSIKEGVDIVYIDFKAKRGY